MAATEEEAEVSRALARIKNRILVFSGKGGGERAAAELNIPFLGRIPIDPGIVISGDEEKPFAVHQVDSEAAKAFQEIVDRVLDDEMP